MSGSAFFGLRKLKGGGIMAAAARHNRRSLQAEVGASGNIDPARSRLNQTLAGPPTAEEVARHAKALMARAGVAKLRRDAVLGIEAVFSLPADHKLDEVAYFRDCLSWCGRRFGGSENIVSADIHRDEAAPHLHVLMVPLIGGRMAGSDMMGGRRKLAEHQQEFHTLVASRYGLRKAPPRLSSTSRKATAEAVLATLRNSRDAALQSSAWAVFRDAIERDPSPFAHALNISLEASKPNRSMTAIFTSKGKGKDRESPKRIGFESGKGPSICSVGFTPPSPPSAHAPLPAALPELEITRVRDCDLSPGAFDPDTGEFLLTGAARRQSHG